MKAKLFFLSILIIVFISSCSNKKSDNQTLVRVEYNNPGLTVDLAVGLWAWPLPFDYDNDGDLDLLVSCPDKPYNGIWFFENPGGSANPVFKPAVRISDAIKNLQISYINNKPRILAPFVEYDDFFESGKWNQDSIYTDKSFDKEIVKIRADQWKYVDYENDGDIDIVVGRGDWGDYGWDNAFNKDGDWQNGPLHGYVFLIENVNDKYNKPVKIKAGGKDIDVFGMPTPNFADFDNDGDLDLICGEFLDGFNYFENIGTREKPVYTDSKRLSNNGIEISMDLQMITPTSVDWDADGDIDLIVGDEDGRVAFIENTGNVVEGIPQFKQPAYIKQEAQYIKFGALVTPVSVDWDNDGDEDIICGSSAGYIGFIENLNGENPAKWAAPVKLKADGKTIRFQAGINGSIQGPAEAKWGYTTISVADWDGDGLNDIIANSIWSKVEWFKNIGSKKSPKLTKIGGVNIDWGGEPAKKPEWNWWNPEEGKFVTQWRTTPYAIDWNKDKMTDLVMLDTEGYLALFQRFNKNGELFIHPGNRCFIDASTGKPLRLNDRDAGHSGRRKFCFTDWDNDGDLDLLANSKNIELFENIGEKDGNTTLKNRGDILSDRLAGHTTSPTIVNWNNDGKPDLLIGAEDGHFYYLPNNFKK